MYFSFIFYYSVFLYLVGFFYLFTRYIIWRASYFETNGNTRRPPPSWWALPLLLSLAVISDSVFIRLSSVKGIRPNLHIWKDNNQKLLTGYSVPMQHYQSDQCWEMVGINNPKTFSRISNLWPTIVFDRILPKIFGTAFIAKYFGLFVSLSLSRTLARILSLSLSDNLLASALRMGNHRWLAKSARVLYRPNIMGGGRCYRTSGLIFRRGIDHNSLDTSGGFVLINTVCFIPYTYLLTQSTLASKFFWSALTHVNCRAPSCAYSR